MSGYQTGRKECVKRLPNGLPMDISKRIEVVAAALFLVVVSVAGAAPVCAQTPETPVRSGKKALTAPEELVRTLYSVHKNGTGPIFGKTGKAHLARFFDERLAALLWKNIVGPPSGDVGNLDFDPLFNAQDIEIKNLRVAPAEIRKSGEDSTVVVTFRNYDRPNRLTFLLHKTGTGWRIRDIDYGSGDRLVKLLSQPF